MDNDKTRIAIRNIIFSQGDNNIFTFKDIELEAKRQKLDYSSYIIVSVLQAMCENDVLAYKGNGRYIINK